MAMADAQGLGSAIGVEAHIQGVGPRWEVETKGVGRQRPVRAVHQHGDTLASTLRGGVGEATTTQSGAAALRTDVLGGAKKLGKAPIPQNVSLGRRHVRQPMLGEKTIGPGHSGTGHAT